MTHHLYPNTTRILESDTHPEVNQRLRAALTKAKRAFRRGGYTLPPTFRMRVVATAAQRGRSKVATWENFPGQIFHTVTIPSHAFEARYGDDYLYYYVIHELCHVMTREMYGRSGHDDNFYEVFFNVAPKALHAYEVDYKPKATQHYLKSVATHTQSASS